MYDTVVFTGPPMTEQTLWPRHCVQNSWGAELHKDLKVSLEMEEKNPEVFVLFDPCGLVSNEDTETTVPNHILLGKEKKL